MSNCIFCKLKDKEIPTEVVYEDDKIFCFHDADPQAPIHVLMIPKKHIASTDEIKDEDGELMGHMLSKVKDVAEILGLKNGYRLVINCGEDGMQTVKHLHLHILGKKKMTWPPG